jgi:hypothetical protein
VTPTPPFGIGCRVIAEFDDDASACAGDEAEFVPVQSAQGPPPAFAFSQRTEGLLAAKELWLKVIQQHTEPVPGDGGRLQVRGSGKATSGSIEVRYGVDTHYHASAPIMDAAGDRSLVLFRADSQEGPGRGQVRVTKGVLSIPWNEIVELQFHVYEAGQSPETKA